MMNLLFRSVVVFHVLFITFIANGQINKNIVILEGIVTDSITEEVLPGIHIAALEANKGTLTDSSGFFSLKLNPGKNKR